MTTFLSVHIIFVFAKIFKIENTLYHECMIDFSPFWKTLQESKENWYTLNKVHHISFSTLNRLKHNKDVSTKTLNDLCRILNCDIKNIIKYVPSESDQAL